MLRKDNLKSNILYKYYCKVEDDLEKKWKKKDFYSFLSNKDNIFILSHPKPVGYIKAREINDEMEIISLLVDKNFRKQGVGEGLLNNLIIIALKKQIESIFLEVSVENKTAIGLYNKFNFTKVGIRKNYYLYNKRHIDAHIMKLALFWNF